MNNTVIKKYEKGQSFVELALSFTVILAILAGLINVSDIYMTYMTLRAAAQEGVNYAMYHPQISYFDSSGKLIYQVDQTGIEARVRNSSNFPLDLTNTSLVNVNINSSTLCSSKTVNITVTYRYDLTAPFFGIVLGSQVFPISATATGPIIPNCVN